MTKKQLTKKLIENPIILPVFAPAWLLSFSRGLLIPVLPLYLREFGASYGLIGVAIAAQELGTLLADIPAGALLRRVGRKRAMLLGLASLVIATSLLFWSRGVSQVIALRFLAGFGVALFNVSRHSYLAEMIKQSARGRAIAAFGGVNRIGVFLGPAVGGALAAIAGLRTPFLLYGATAGLAFTLVALFVRRTWAAIPGGEQGVNLLGTLKNHYHLLLTAGAGQLFMQTVRAGRNIIIPLIGADVLGLDVGAIGTIISTAAAVDMTLFYPAGWLMDNFGRKFAIVPSIMILTAGMALLPLVSSYIGLLAVTCLISFGNGLGSGTMLTLGADLAPPAERGEFLGAWHFIGDGGVSLGPVIVGGVADLLALPAAALALAACGVAAGLIFARLVPEPLEVRPKRRPLLLRK
jgi:MFS family permease